MKKQFYFSFFILLLFSFAFIGCTKNDTYKNSIPKGAQLVLSINFKSLFDKADLKNFKESNFYNSIINNFPSDFKDKELIEKLINEPEISGIDFEKDVYVFRINDKEMTCLLLKLKSFSKFQNLLKDMLKDKLPTIEETDDYYFIKPSKEEIIGWDNEKLIYIKTDIRKYRDSINFYLTEYMKSEKNNSIFSENDFSEFYKNKKDFNLWFNLEQAFNKDNDDKEKEDDLISPDLLKGSKFYFNLDFANGEIRLTGKSIMGENLQKKFDMNDIAKDGLSNNMMTAVSGKGLAYLSFAIQLRKYLELLGNIVGKNILDMPLNETMKISALTNMFSGEFVICLDDFSKKVTTVNYTFYNNFGDESLYDTSYIPVVSIYATADTNGLHNLLGSLEIPFQKTDNYYEIITGETDRIYIGFKNNIMLLSFNKDIIDKFTIAQSASEALMNHKYSNSFKNNPSAMFINLNYETFSEGTQGFFEKVFGDFNKVIPYIELFDSLIYEARKDNTFSAVIKLKDSSKNSLYNILHNLDKNLKFN